MKENSLQESACDFLRLVAAGKIDSAYKKYVGSSFKHHNPYFRGDTASLKEAMQADADANPRKQIEIQFAVEAGDRVAVFSKLKQNPEDTGYALAHFFRFENGRVAEAWDICQSVPEERINENGMF
jgi:predicted SnoaL-like aldol condensation-catalyzing enzyme